MKIDSERCKELIKTYQVETIDLEKIGQCLQQLSMDVALSKAKDTICISGIKEMTDEQIDDLALAIKKVRDELNTKD